MLVLLAARVGWFRDKIWQWLRSKIWSERLGKRLPRIVFDFDLTSLRKLTPDDVDVLGVRESPGVAARVQQAFFNKCQKKVQNLKAKSQDAHYSGSRHGA